MQSKPKKIDRSNNINISTQLFEILKNEIIKNNWKENDKFYSIRQISIKYDVNSNTVLKVFQALEEQGYLYSIKGKGCFIKKGYNLNISERMAPILNTFRFGQNTNKNEINLSNGAPCKEFFPVEFYKETIYKILSDEKLGRELLGYQPIQGIESLRIALAKYVKKYGINTTKDNIIIGSGTQNILELITSTFRNIQQQNILLSNPTYQNAGYVFKNTCNVLNINLYDDGWDINEFQEILEEKKIHFIYIITNFQNPTGISWSFYKKKKLIELANKYDFYIIEDDCFSDFYYQGTTPSAIKALDKHERVFYIKTFSKIVMPGIALAMFIPPKQFLEKFSINKYFIDTTTSGLNQKFLETFINSNKLDEHLENLRNHLKTKMEYTLKKLSAIPHIKINYIPKGGFFIWIELAHYIDDEKFYYKSRLQGLSILPGFIFCNQGNELSYTIRISIVSASISEIDKGLDIIKNILTNCSNLPNNI